MSSISTPTPTPALLRQALDELAAAAGLLERGQADTPLSDEVARVAALPAGSALTVILLAPESDLRLRALTWILGEAPEAAGVAGTVDLRVGAGAAETRVLAPEPGGDITAGDGPCLVVSATLVAEEPSAAQAQACDRLTAAGAAIWRVGFRRDGDPIGRPRPSAPSEIALPGVIVSPDLTPPSGLGRGPGAADLPRRLAGLVQARRGLAAGEMVQDRQQAEIRALQVRQKREQDASRPAEAAPAEAGPQFDQLRSRLNDEFGRLVQELRENGRRAGLRTGEIHTLLDQLLANLRGQDLAQETAGKKIRLSLKPDVADELRERFAEALQAQLQADAARIAAAAEAVSAIIVEAGRRHGGAEPIRVTAQAVAGSLWAPIEEGLHLQVRYRGEMRRRGFLQRLGEGRRMLFVILMAGSLIGGFMGFNVRRSTAMGPVFLIFFIVAVGYTFYSWRKEEQIGFEDELIRLRDTLSPEFARLLADALRERQVRLQAVLEDVRRMAFGAVDGMQRQAGSEKARASDAERKAARTRLKVVEERLRDVQALNAVMVRARGAFERAMAEGRRELAAAAGGRPAPVAPPSRTAG